MKFQFLIFAVFLRIAVSAQFVSPVNPVHVPTSDDVKISLNGDSSTTFSIGFIPDQGQVDFRYELKTNENNPLKNFKIFLFDSQMNPVYELSEVSNTWYMTEMQQCNWMISFQDRNGKTFTYYGQVFNPIAGT